MTFQIKFTEVADNDLELHRKSGDKKVLLKINTLINELREHPTYGTGKPEQLKHYKIPTWSRRISGKHRLVYRIFDDSVIVLLLSAWGHYDDK